MPPQSSLQPDTHFAPSVSSAPRLHLPGSLLHFCILLTGFGTVFIGPMLPTLTTQLHISDRGAGSLLAAQFVGAFLGGWTTGSPLRRSMLRGLAAATVGFVLLAIVLLQVPRLTLALPPLALLGFGIGQTLTSVNLLASDKWVHRRGSALTLLNFTWSFGALIAPALLLKLLGTVPAGNILLVFAALLAIGLAATLILRQNIAPAVTSASVSAGLSRPAYRFFCLLLFLYGGVETSLGGWLATFDHRYAASAGWLGMAASTTAFWASLTLARLVAPVLLNFMQETLLLRAGLALAVAALLLMLAAHGTVAITLCAALAGLSLSPWFPLVLSSLVAHSPRASQAGRVIAVSGLGAAALPWLVGQVSAASGSLRAALLLPAAGAAALLLLSFQRGMRAPTPAKRLPS